jgi:APA family basic amino acid/polyamine antiporter
LTNTYERLVGFAVFADWIFFALAGVALLVFRRTRPAAPRPFPTPLYPLVPLLFIAAGVGIVVNLYIADPATALVGSAVLGAGVPVFLIWRRVR